MTAPDYRQLVGSYLDLRWQLDPVAATLAGVTSQDSRLGAFTRPDVRAAIAAFKALSTAFEETEVESGEDEIDQTAVLNDIRAAIWRMEKERPHENNPEFHLSHLLTGLFALLTRRDRPAVGRGRALAGRLRDVPRFLSDAVATVQRPARVFTETALQVAQGGRALLREAVPEFAGGLPAALRDEIGEALPPARDALGDFHEFLGGELLGRSDGDFAIGRDAFDRRLHFEHALRETAPELLRYGEALVKEVEAELVVLADRLAPGTPWRALTERLRGDHPAADGLVGLYAEAMRRAERFVRDKDLVGVPEGALDVIATPQFMKPLIPFAAYDPPGAFAGDRTGFFYVTVPDAAALRDHCRHEIGCTALHEGYPGHHLQHLVAQSQPSPVRRVVGSPLTVEGWAMYCEQLMADEGFLSSPEERFFQRVHLLWRAARIVLDIRLHTMGMREDEAVRYLVEVLGLSRANAEAEVRRYCGNPAYQLCYAVGRRELLKLREDCRTRDGNGFSMRRFHDEVLSYGGLPVALIRWGLGLTDK